MPPRAGSARKAPDSGRGWPLHPAKASWDLDAAGAKRHDARMTDEQRIRAIEELLAQIEAAHGAYEATDLNGVYDEQWPAWYAAYMLAEQSGTELPR